MISRLWFLVILSIPGTQLYSQQKSKWMLNLVLNTDNGLAQNSVNSLYFDKQTGFLWIATEGGLVLYNGVSTKVFDTRSVPAFKMARMWGFFNSPDNRVMIMDKAGTALHIDHNELDTQRALHFNTYYDGVSHFERVYPLRDYTENSHQKALNEKAKAFLNPVLFINDTTTLGFTASAAYIIRGKVSYIPADLPAHPVFLYLRRGHDLAILDSLACKGYYLDIDNGISFPIAATEPTALKGKPVIYADNMSNAHYLLNGKKIYKIGINKKGINLQLFAELPHIPENVTAISVNPQNNKIFIGTLYEGLFIYSASYFYTYQFSDSLKFRTNRNLPPWSPVRNIYSCVLPDTSHAILGYLSNKNAANQPVLLNLTNASYQFAPISNIDVFMSEIDTGGNIYLPAEEEQVFSYASHAGYKSHAYNFKSAAYYYDAKYNRMWAIEFQKDYLGFIQHDSLQSFVHYSPQEIGKLVSIKRSNDILLTHSLTTLCFVDEENQKLEKVCSLNNPCIRDVYIDPDRLVWISTYGQGIYVYELSTKKMYHPKTDSRQYMLFSHCTIDDGYGNFFIPTNNGLFRVKRTTLIEACKDSSKTLFYHYYDKTNGLMQNEFNGGCMPAYNKLPDGDILLPSVQGLLRIFTGVIGVPENYPLYIQQVTSRTASYDLKDGMMFPQRERSLSFEVNFAQWEYPATSGLSYRLDDDSAWTFVQAGERKILLTDLAGGEHTLELRNQFDLEGKKISTLISHFYIGKKYFEQAWFWIIVAIVWLGLI